MEIYIILSFFVGCLCGCIATAFMVGARLSKQDNKCTCPQPKCNYRIVKDNTCSQKAKVKFDD
jgi:hypothetical protein